ncbi:hypothetical protein EJ08DRAFT_652549 [Tothia fuscella]|uniref:Uncharacterized protein n=1 Tax=Tothia fuscella TaxID=1048955 RepID=A0A9P4TU45_9PEZI|nr:hypothetical protein EJ08DRAFT_652549 [Tothia fuscella]
MCEIATIKYVHSDGRTHTVERKRFCPRSDGQNPCRQHKLRNYTEMVPPNLSYDSTPVSTGMPGTPTTATAPHYEIREPLQRSDSKGKDNARPVHLSFSNRRKTSPRRVSSHERRPHFEEDDDPIVAIEDHGFSGPRTPTNSGNRHLPSMGSPLPTRVPRRQPTLPPIINQQIPPPPSVNSSRPSALPSYHRRNTTAPESISFHADGEHGRANAGDELRRQNREYFRQKDEAKRQQEEQDRRLAEKLAKKEREEKAADEFSLREYERLQSKDRARKEREDKRDKDAYDQSENDRIVKEINERKSKEQRKRRAEEELRLREEDLLLQEKIKREDLRAEQKMQEELARHRREQLEADTAGLREVQAQIDCLEYKLRQSHERSAARERAEKLQEDVRKHDLLMDEIQQLEDEQRRDHINDNESEIRRLEADLARRNRTHRSSGRREFDQINGPHLGERRNIGAPPRSPVNILQSRNPLEDVEIRRAYGEQVLAHDRNAAALSSPGLSRRNTIGNGNGHDRAREQRYRELRHWYPN